MKVSNYLKKATDGFAYNGKEYRIVPVDQLQVDPAYQRALVKAAVQKNAVDEFYNSNAMRPLTVSLRTDGLYWILDGHHRHAITVQRGIEKYLVCEVIKGLTKQQEAAVFLLLNNMKNVNIHAKFRAGYCAGDEKCKRIFQIVKEMDFHIALKPGHPGYGTKNTISNVGTLLYIFDSFGGENILADTLAVIKGAFTLGLKGEVSVTAKRDIFLRGIAFYLFTSKGDTTEVIRALKGRDPDDFKMQVYRRFPGVRGKDATKNFATVVSDTVASLYRRHTAA